MEEMMIPAERLEYVPVEFVHTLVIVGRHGTKIHAGWYRVQDDVRFPLHTDCGAEYRRGPTSGMAEAPKGSIITCGRCTKKGTQS